MVDEGSLLAEGARFNVTGSLYGEDTHAPWDGDGALQVVGKGSTQALTHFNETALQLAV